MNEWSSFKSFLDIDEKLSVSSNASDERMQHKSIQNDKTKVQEYKKHQHIMIVKCVKKKDAPTIGFRQKKN